MPSALAASCGPGLDFQKNSHGYVVWVGKGHTPGDGILKNLWQAQLPRPLPFYAPSPPGANSQANNGADIQ